MKDIVFNIDMKDDTLNMYGKITKKNANNSLEIIKKFIYDNYDIKKIDLSQIIEVNSFLIAILIEIKKMNANVEFIDISQNLFKILKLYNLSEIVK